MRIFLTKSELESDTGKQLLALTLRLATDGKIELNEIKELIVWLRENKDANIAANSYLQDIMSRITVDRLIDQDELLELQLAIERVIPNAYRAPVIEARKILAEQKRNQKSKSKSIEKQKQKEERKRMREEEYARSMRLRHTFSKVAGVTFPNDDGTERQDILSRCNPGEQLFLKHDAYSKFSLYATQIFRTNCEQLGHVPEYLAEQICSEIENGYRIICILKDITGGTLDKPTRGANFVVFFVAKDVTNIELEEYMTEELEGYF
jgi:hypothetical protein